MAVAAHTRLEAEVDVEPPMDRENMRLLKKGMSAITSEIVQHLETGDQTDEALLDLDEQDRLIGRQLVIYRDPMWSAN